MKHSPMLAPLPSPKGSGWKPQSTVLVPQTPQGVRSSGKVGRRGEGGVSGASSLTSVRGDRGAVSFGGEEHLRVSGVPSMAHLTPGGPLCPLVGWPHLVQLRGRVGREKVREVGRESEGEVWGEVMEVLSEVRVGMPWGREGEKRVLSVEGGRSGPGEEITDGLSPSCMLSLCVFGVGNMVLLELHESHLNPAN